MAQKDIDIAEAVSIIEKAVVKETESLIRKEIKEKLVEEFLETLCHKVEQIHPLVKVVNYDSSENFINFCCEIPKIDPNDTQIPHQLIKTIDNISLKFFFKKETNLRLFNFCSKYFLFSQYCLQRNVNNLFFNWSTNRFHQNKICFCFMCKFHLELSEEQEKQKQELKNEEQEKQKQELKNDDQ